MAKRDVIDVVLAKLPPPGKKSGERGSDYDGDDDVAFGSAVEDFISAVGKKDAKKAASALRDAIRICSMEEPEEDDED